MKCPKCQGETLVINTTQLAKENKIRRRHKCDNCKNRFNTIEAISQSMSDEGVKIMSCIVAGTTPSNNKLTLSVIGKTRQDLIETLAYLSTRLAESQYLSIDDDANKTSSYKLKIEPTKEHYQSLITDPCDSN